MQMAPAQNQQSSIQVELLESHEQITARNFDEFRSQTMALYHNYARSMNLNISNLCAFRHPEGSQSGSWYGACESAAAEDLDYGLIRTGDGSEIGYLGSTHSALAQGLGAMIALSPISFHLAR